VVPSEGLTESLVRCPGLPHSLGMLPVSEGHREAESDARLMNADHWAGSDPEKAFPETLRMRRSCMLLIGERTELSVLIDTPRTCSTRGGMAGEGEPHQVSLVRAMSLPWAISSSLSLARS